MRQLILLRSFVEKVDEWKDMESVDEATIKKPECNILEKKEEGTKHRMAKQFKERESYMRIRCGTNKCVEFVVGTDAR